MYYRVIETRADLPWTETLVRVCPLAIVRTDTDGRVCFCNPAFEQTFLYDAVEALGRTIDELIGPDGGEARRKDGTLVDVESHTIPEFDDGVCVGSSHFLK